MGRSSRGGRGSRGRGRGSRGSRRRECGVRVEVRRWGWLEVAHAWQGEDGRGHGFGGHAVTRNR